MKKVLIVISLSLLLFGCGKEQKNITVNIYWSDKEVVKENQKETKTDNNVVSDTEKDKDTENKVDSNSNNNDNKVVTPKEYNNNDYSISNESTVNNNTSINEKEEKKRLVCN